MTTKSQYLPDTVYFAMIDDLLTANTSFDPKSRVIELIGEVADVWPQRVLVNADKKLHKNK